MKPYKITQPKSNTRGYVVRRRRDDLWLGWVKEDSVWGDGWWYIAFGAGGAVGPYETRQEAAAALWKAHRIYKGQMAQIRSKT